MNEMDSRHAIVADAVESEQDGKFKERRSQVAFKEKDQRHTADMRRLSGLQSQMAQVLEATKAPDSALQKRKRVRESVEDKGSKGSKKKK